MEIAKRNEFTDLFKEFIKSYPYTAEGLRHIATYAEQNRQNGLLAVNANLYFVINYFTNTVYEQNLTEQADINIKGNKLIKELAKEMQQPGVPALRDEDLFDMFSHWLVEIKKYDFGTKKDLKVNEIIEIIPKVKYIELQPEYSLNQYSEDTGLDDAELNRWIRAIKRKKQAILCGSPGTGKTFIAEKLAKYLISGGDGFSELIQFHPAYSYEDFIQGIRPQSEHGKLHYPIIPGRFLEFCAQAKSCQDICVLIIDEINRANLAQVFGELMYLLEYRDQKIPLAGGNTLCIPENVRIIGTMNTADRSIALVDHALRRRFAFIEIRSNYEVLQRYHENTGFAVDGLIKKLKDVNNAIADKHYEVGISFFLTENLADNIEDIWSMEIEPYLEEYFFDDLQKIDEFRWHSIKEDVLL